VVEFLSADWLALFGAAVIEADTGLTFRLDQVVRGAPGGDIRYRVTIEGGRVRVASRPGGSDGPDAAPPDATVTLGYRTAVDLAAGRRTAHDAIRHGEVKLAADPVRVHAASAAIAALGDAFERVREQTRYPPPGG